LGLIQAALAIKRRRLLPVPIFMEGLCRPDLTCLYPQQPHVREGSEATFRVCPRYFRFNHELGHCLMQLAGLMFFPPETPQKPREQTCMILIGKR
jgi:hypothetical protein